MTYTGRTQTKNEMQWRQATLYTHKVRRAPLYWTPDPEHSPILRMMRSGEEIEFVPEIKFDRWIIARIGEQTGWLDLDMVRLMEFDDDQTQPKKPDLPEWLETSFTAGQPVRVKRERETDELGSTDALLREVLETEQVAEAAHQQATQQEDRTPQPPPTPAEPPDVQLSGGEIRRLMRHLRGIRDVLNNALNRSENTSL